MARVVSAAWRSARRARLRNISAAAGKEQPSRASPRAGATATVSSFCQHWPYCCSPLARLVGGRTRPHEAGERGVREHRIAARELLVRQEAVSFSRRVIFLANRGAVWSMRAPDGRATALPYAPRPSGACSGRPRSSAEGDAGFWGSLLGPSADQRPPKAGTGRKRVYAIHTNSIKILH